MSLNKVKAFQQLGRQDGSYLYINDRSDWPILGFSDGDLVNCSVLYLNGDESNRVLNADGDGVRFSIVAGDEYVIYTYGVVPWVSGAYVVDDLRWHDDSIWKALIDTSSVPGTGAEWREVTFMNAEELNAISTELTTNIYSKPVYENPLGSYSVKKTSDHVFKVTWNRDEDIVSSRLLDYTNTFIKDILPEDNTVTVTLEKDGVYIVEVMTVEGVLHYTEIYDFTDSEKCFLDLVVNVLCECVDCNDCPGPQYNRALNYVNTYQLIREIVNADRAVDNGLLSSEILRSDFVSSLGLLITKLGLMVNECVCGKED